MTPDQIERVARADDLDPAPFTECLPAHLTVIEGLSRAWAVFGNVGRAYVGVKGLYTTRDIEQAKGVCGIELTKDDRGAIQVLYHIGPLDDSGHQP